MVIFTPSPSAVASHAGPCDSGAGEIGGSSGAPDDPDELDAGGDGCSLSEEDVPHAMATTLTADTTTMSTTRMGGGAAHDTPTARPQDFSRSRGASVCRNAVCMNARS